MKFLNIKLLVIAVCMFAASSAFADFSYDFSVNTSSINGTAGYIDLQFNPGISSTGSASATITNFTSDATLGTATPSGSSVTGTLPSTVTINNTSTTGYNDYLQALTFGNTINFVVDLSGATGNSFAVSFLNSTQTAALLTNDNVNGYAATVDVNPNGAVVNNLSSQTNVVTPIPAAAYLLGSGLIGLVGIRRKMKN